MIKMNSRLFGYVRCLRFLLGLACPTIVSLETSPPFLPSFCDKDLADEYEGKDNYASDVTNPIECHFRCSDRMHIFICSSGI